MARHLAFCRCLAIAIGLGTVGSTFAQLIPGNLVVLRVGDGATGLTANTTQTSLLQFDTTGAPVGTPIVLPTAGAGAITNTGNSTTEGALSRSADGQFLLFGSYLTPAGNAAAAGTAANFQRAIVRVDSAGTAATFGLGTTAFSGSNIRSAASTNGTDLWATGNSNPTGSGGTWYTNGTTTTQISGTQNNSRVVSVQNNTLYYSTGSTVGGAVGIQSLGSPPPTVGPVTPTPVITGVAGQLTGPMQYVFSPGPLTAGSFAYVADQGAAASSVQRFNFDGTSWSLAYNFSAAANTSGLAVDFSGVNPVIFATAPSGLFRVTDLGVTAAMQSIATPGTNFAFRGLSFAPVPEPATVLSICAIAGGIAYRFRRRAKTETETQTEIE